MTERRKHGLIVKELWEDMAEYVYKYVLRCMPKEDRFTLGEDIRSIIFSVEIKLKHLERRYGNRGVLLNEVDVAAGVLMDLIRLGIRLQSIPKARSEPMAEKLDKIGSYIGGLKKSHAKALGTDQ